MSSNLKLFSTVPTQTYNTARVKYMDLSIFEDLHAKRVDYLCTQQLLSLSVIFYVSL